MQFGPTRGAALDSRGAALNSQDYTMQFSHTRGAELVKRGAALDSAQDCSMQFGPHRSVSPKPAFPSLQPISRTLMPTRGWRRSSCPCTISKRRQRTGELCKVSND
jgi:hypothetical protein